MASKPTSIQVTVPVTIDPANPSMSVQLELQVQNFPQPGKQVPTISIENSRGDFRRFAEIQGLYARMAIAKYGTAQDAAKEVGVTRQILTKWAKTIVLP